LPYCLTPVLQEREEIVLPFQQSFADDVGRGETPGGGSMLQRGTEFGLAHFDGGEKEAFPVPSPQLLQLLQGNPLLRLVLHLLQLELLEDLTKSSWDTPARSSARGHPRRIGQRNDEEDRDQRSRLPHRRILLPPSQDAAEDHHLMMLLDRRGGVQQRSGFLSEKVWYLISAIPSKPPTLSSCILEHGGGTHANQVRAKKERRTAKPEDANQEPWKATRPS
jgi:hypothetical protein